MMNRLIGRPALQLMARRFKYTHNYDEMVNANKVVVFMKGTPDQPQVYRLILLLFCFLVATIISLPCYKVEKREYSLVWFLSWCYSNSRGFRS